MLELGPDGAAMHQQCGAFVARQEIDLLMACGELSRFTVEGADKAGMERCCHYTSKHQLAQEVLKAFGEEAAAGICSLQSVLDLKRYAIGGGISARPETTQIISGVSKLFAL